MKIAMISYHTCPLAAEEGKETGGMNVYVLELARELGALGVTVDIFTRSQGSDNQPIVQVKENVRLFHLVAGPQAPVPKKKLVQHLDEFVTSLLKAVGSLDDYDLLHAHYYLSGMVAERLLWREGKQIPIVINFHTLALIKNLVARSVAEQESQQRVETEFALMQQVAAIISPSEFDRQYVHSLYGVSEEKITVIPPGYNPILFFPQKKEAAKLKLGAEAEEAVLLFVGRIEPLKGIDSILYALKILNGSLPIKKLNFWIVGGDVSQPVKQWSAELQRIERLCSVLDLHTTVTFLGQKKQTELPDYYNAADLLIMPSHYESFGMVALEAMACGTPVILSNVSGISSLFDQKHESLLTTVNNPIMLAEQIRELLTNCFVYHQAQYSMAAQVADLSWPKVAQRILTEYGRVTTAQRDMT